MKHKDTNKLTRVAMLLLVALFSLTGARADELTVYKNATATNEYVPVYGYYADAYNKCEFVIPADELADMQGGTISQMTFYLSTSASDSWGSAEFQVFMKEVNDATISAFSGTADATIVYEGSLDGTQSEMTIEFTSEYQYQGGNLLVGIYQTVKGNYKSAYFTGETVNEASISGYSYNSFDAISPTPRNFVPKTTFTYTPSSGVVYYKPKDLTMGEITTTTAAISWTAPAGDVTGYAYQYKKAAEGDEAWSTEQTVTSTSVSLSNLDSSTPYKFRVKSVYAGGESGYATINFTTDCDIANLPFNEGFEYGIPCWTLIYESDENASEFGISSAAAQTGSKCFRFSSYRSSSSYNQYLISPVMNATKGVVVQFSYKTDSSNAETFKVGYSTTTNDPSAFTWGDGISAKNTSWALSDEYVFPDGTKYVAIWYYSDFQYRLYVDDFSFSVPTAPKPTDLAASNIGTTSATLSWSGTYDSSVLQYRTAAKNMNLDAWHQVGDDKAATATLKTYTFDLSEYSGTGSIAIRHYSVTDMFNLIIDDIVVTNAGGNVVFSEDFESNSLGSLSTYDIDGDGNNWETRSANSADGNGNPYCNGSYYVASASYDNNTGALTPDNWLVLSNVELGGTLTFVARGQDPSWPAENFGIFVTNESGTFDAVPAGEWSNEITTTANTYQLTGLTPNTPYEWRVKGVVGEDEASWSSSTFSTIRDNFKTFITAGNWDVAENWYPAGVPALTDEVSIAADVTIPSGVVAVAKKVSLNGGSVTIKDGGELKQGAAALQIAMEKEITGFGTGTGKYALISAPFSGLTQLTDNTNWYSVNISSDSEYEFYGFDPTQTNEWVNYESSSSHSLFDGGDNGTGLLFDNGYLYAKSDNKTLNFTGNTWSSLNNTVTVDYTYDATSEASFNGWKLIGNPFTCTGYITYSEDATFYKLNAAGTGFDAYENAVALAPGEGAFMRVTASGTITYSSEPLSVEPVAAGSFFNLVLPAHGEETDQDADPTILIFADNADNTSDINAYNGQTINVQLTGRTLYKDDSWNTICLPFDVTIAGSPLDGATVMELNTTSSSLTESTLTLKFDEVSAIEAGKPYLIKWTSGTNLTEEDLVFNSVEIKKDLVPAVVGSNVITFSGNYAPVQFEAGDKNILYVGANNQLYYPSAEVTMNAFRAYFQVDDSSLIKHFALKFSGDDATAIETIANGQQTTEGAIYNVAGQRLNKAQKGVNIVNGKKILK